MTIRRWAEVSSRTASPAPVQGEHQQDPWWGDAKTMRHHGAMRRFYRTGELAKALGRSSETIRRWERHGWLPKPPRTGSVNNIRGQRRAYPAEFTEAVVEIAEDEGVVGRKVADFGRNRFFERVNSLPYDW